ncbi:MAG: biopolymer transporter ExbD [Bacteroidota bacterium]
MPKVKPHRSTPSLDMTPMVDLAFLLVTFFMLTTKFAPEEPVQVDMPKSHANFRLPDTDILTLTVSKDGKVFFGLDGQGTRQTLLANMGNAKGIKFTQEQAKRFAVLPSFGLPIGQLQKYLDMDAEERKAITQPGIPTDSLNNELSDWILYSRLSNPKIRIAIKGDNDTDFPVINKVIETLKSQDVNRFNLITNLIAEPNSEPEK